MTGSAQPQAGRMKKGPQGALVIGDLTVKWRTEEDSNPRPLDS
jgi:hypothetical protein